MSLKNERVVIEREEEDIKPSEPLEDEFDSEPSEVVIKPKKKPVKTEKPKRNTYQSHLNGTITRMREVVREELDAYKQRKEEAKQRAREEAERKAKEEEEKRLFNEWKKAQENKKNQTSLERGGAEGKGLESATTVFQSKRTVKKVATPKAIVEERDERDEDNITDAPAPRKSKKPVNQKRGGLKPIDTRSTVPQDFVEDSIW